MQQEKGRGLPKFGEWDVNNPTSAEGFTVIFNKARNEKKRSRGGEAEPKSHSKNKGGLKPEPANKNTPSKTMKKWFCCGWVSAADRSHY